MSYEIKIASSRDVQLMLDWAKEEGWNPGIHDDICFHAADPQGFFMGYLDDIPIASLSAVKYSNDFGFLGLYLVKPSFRHQGYGIKICYHGLNYLNNIATLGLDGVLAQQANYQKLGFKLIHRNIRFSGIAENNKCDASNLISLESIALPLITTYEKDLFPSPRALFLSAWINYATKTVGLLKNNQLVGYGVIRQCVEGYKIGPLFADDDHAAEQIFTGLTNEIAGQKIFLDIPEPNSAAIRLCENHQMSSVFETARMYRYKDPKLNLAKIYGITSFELG